MNVKYIVFLLLFLSLSATSQKLKKNFSTIKYFRPAIYQKPLSHYFNIVVNETRKEQDGSISEMRNSYCNFSQTNARKKFYYSAFSINDFYKTGIVQTEEEKDTISKLMIVTGNGSIIKKEPFATQIKNAEGKVTGVQWFVNVTLQIPCKAIFEDEKSKQIFLDSTDNLEITFNYPKSYPDIKISHFSSKQSAMSSLQRNQQNLFPKFRDLYIQKWARALRKKLHHTLNNDEDFFTLDLSYIKGKGDMKKAYLDIDILNSRMDDLISLIKLNFKSKNNLNWHTEELQTEFSSIEVELENLLQVEMDLKDAEKESRFDDIAFLGIYKNLLWCKFFTGKFDEVIKITDELNKQDEENDGSFKVEMKVYWENTLNIARIYKEVYESNKSNFNWI